MLCEIAHRLNNTVRGGDVVARLGGDEFAALLNGSGGIQRAEEVAQRILDTFARHYEFQGAVIPVRSSIA